MKLQILTSIMISLLFTTWVNAQEVKFGKVSKKEFQEKFYPQDTSANAAVLYKKRRTNYSYNSSTGWSLMTEVHERIKIYNQDGFENATKKIQIYTRGNSNGDESVGIKAYTYNLEGNKIVKTRLEQKNVFNEETKKNWDTYKFTMPNLKEGCIIEWKYLINSPYTNYIDDVICQYKIPIKYLDVKVQIPEFYEFKHLTNRYYPLPVVVTMVQKNYSFTEKSQMVRQGSVYNGTHKSKREYNNASINEFKYVLKTSNIPALTEEKYVNNIYNYQAKIDFEISAYKPKNGIAEHFNSTWENVTRSIYRNSYFGEQLNKKSHFKKDLATITAGKTSEDDIIISIFQFVKNKIKWNNVYSKYTSLDGVTDAYQKGVGNVAEINLTLIAMLREAGLSANPILVSTRTHGIAISPTKEGFNYVIAGVETRNGVTLLDATEKYSLPNVLPLRDLNWKGRLIRKDGSSKTVSLYPKKYSSKNIKLIANIDADGTLSGMLNTTLTNLNALQYREDKSNLAEDELMQQIESTNNGIEIDKFKLINKKNLSRPIIEIVKFNKENEADIIEDKIYISPLLFLTLQENPFKLKERLYPIDYGSPWKNEINISLQIPEGYTVDSKPKDISLVLPDNLGSYELNIKLKENTIQINSNTKLNSAILGANYYQKLKEFYKQAIDNQLEKIVLKHSQT